MKKLYMYFYSLNLSIQYFWALRAKNQLVIHILK